MDYENKELPNWGVRESPGLQNKKSRFEGGGGSTRATLYESSNHLLHASAKRTPAGMHTGGKGVKRRNRKKVGSRRRRTDVREEGAKQFNRKSPLSIDKLHNKMRWGKKC